MLSQDHDTARDDSASQLSEHTCPSMAKQQDAVYTWRPRVHTVGPFCSPCPQACAVHQQTEVLDYLGPLKTEC